ncbi:unnamed protein product [Urochloa decumbens]|uniref:G domain-containing protein n=1 Tax=Urochloa decumbens TaxID=240449 RepID=A0ABC9AS81_9POAL
MAPSSSSASSLPAPLASKTLTPRHARILRRNAPHAAAAAAAPRPLLLSFPAFARRRSAGLRAPAAHQQTSAEYQFEDDDEEELEEEYEYDGEEKWEEDEDDGDEEMDVEAMEETRGAAADLANRLARELHIDSLLPKVAIIGRPNVGKSALFNRLVGGNRAIVVDEPGVTRDRLYGRSYWGDQEFMVIDTGGVITLSKSQAGVMEELAVTTTVGMDGIPLATREAAIARMPSMIEKQAVAAVEEAAVILFVVDGQAGIVAADIEISDWLRRNYSEKCVILAVNKCESPQKGQMQALDFWSLGFSPLPISAIIGTGTGDLLDLVCLELKKTERSRTKILENRKSSGDWRPPSWFYQVHSTMEAGDWMELKKRKIRTIVSPVSGTTRDAIDTEFTAADGEKYKLIDTAGIRPRAAVISAGSTTGSLSVKRAFRAIRRSDVVALVIEAMACITEQDYKTAERIEKEGKACVIVVNKWDTIPNKNHESTTHYEQDDNFCCCFG